MRLPRSFDNVAIRVEALHADVFRLIPLLDDRDSVACEAVSESSDGVRTRKIDPEVEERRQPDFLVTPPQRECEPIVVVEHQQDPMPARCEGVPSRHHDLIFRAETRARSRFAPDRASLTRTLTRGAEDCLRPVVLPAFR